MVHIWYILCIPWYIFGAYYVPHSAYFVPGVTIKNLWQGNGNGVRMTAAKVTSPCNIAALKKYARASPKFVYSVH